MASLKFIKTMQPTLVEAPPPDDGRWLHEIKYDGYRIQLLIEPGAVRAITRNGHDWSDKFPGVISDARMLQCTSAIVDGELCVQDANGVTDFGALPGAIKSRRGDLVYFAFDLLHLDGEDLRAKPIEERRSRLRWALRGPTGRIQISDEFDGDGQAFFDLVDRLGLEGIVSKRKGSRYTSGSTKAWLKAKCWHTETFDVIGVTRDGEGAPHALLADSTGYRGSAFLSLPMAARDLFWRYVEAQGLPAPPVRMDGKQRASWVRPGLRASVRYLKGSDKLRHASVKELDLTRQKPPKGDN